MATEGGGLRVKMTLTPWEEAWKIGHCQTRPRHRPPNQVGLCTSHHPHRTLASQTGPGGSRKPLRLSNMTPSPKTLVSNSATSGAHFYKPRPRPIPLPGNKVLYTCATIPPPGSRVSYTRTHSTPTNLLCQPPATQSHLSDQPQVSPTQGIQATPSFAFTLQCTSAKPSTVLFKAPPSVILAVHS